MPIKIVYAKGTAMLSTNIKGKLEVVKTKATNKDN